MRRIPDTGDEQIREGERIEIAKVAATEPFSPRFLEKIRMARDKERSAIAR